jgi:DNA-binding transcriptional LysR family regulator
LGIARLPMYLITKDIVEGRLINLLPDFEDTSTNIYAVYLMRQNMSPKIRVFLKFLQPSFIQPTCRWCCQRH